MPKKNEDGYNELTDVRITRVGLCKSPAVPDATHVILKSRDADGEEIRHVVDPGGRKADEANLEKAAGFMMGLAKLIKSLAGKTEEPPVSTATTESENDMDLSQVTIDQIQKANPALYESIVAKALESVKDKDGKRVGSVDVQQSVDEKDGSRVAGVKLAGVTDAAVDEKKDTVSSPKDDSQAGMNGGVAKAIADLQKGMGELATTLKSMCEKVEKLDTSRPGEAAAEKEEKAAVTATQNAVDTTGDSNGGVAKIDTSRPGESAIESKEKAAVKANAAAVDASAKAGDSGIGAVETGDCCKEANAALKDEVATLKEQVSQLTKAMQPRLENVEKAMGKMIREKLAKTEEVQKSVEEPVVKARSQQAGQFDESGAKDAVRVKKTVFDSAISTVALAKAGQEAR